MWELGSRIIFYQDLAALASRWQKPEILFLAYQIDNPELLSLLLEDSKVVLEPIRKDNPSTESNVLFSFFKAWLNLMSLLHLEKESPSQISFKQRAFQEAVAPYLLYLKQHAVSVLEKLPEESLEEPPHETISLPSAFALVSGGISLIHDYLETYEPDLLGQGIEKLNKAFNDIREALIYLVWQKQTRGPFKDRNLNLLVNILKAVEEGCCHENFLELVWRDFSDYFIWSRRNFRRLLRITKSHRNLLYGESKEAFEILKSLLFQKGNDPKILESCGVIQEFFDFYSAFRQELSKEFKKLEESRLKGKICPRCHRQNSSNAWWCKPCGFVFPQASPFWSFEISDEASKNSFSMTPLLERIINAVDDFKEEEISQDAFFSVLDWADKMIEALQAHNTFFEEKNPVLYPEVKDLLHACKTGIEMLLSGLLSLQMWSSSKSQEDFKNGMSLVFEGTQKINDMFLALASPEDSLYLETSAM